MTERTSTQAGDQSPFSAEDKVLRVIENALAIPQYAYGDNEAARYMRDALELAAAFVHSETAPKFTPRADLRGAVARSIEEHPLIASLLYDIDLMPEQIKDERRYNYMLAVIYHMKQAIKNAPNHSPASEVAAPTPAPSEPGNAGLATSRSAASGAPNAAPDGSSAS